MNKIICNYSLRGENMGYYLKVNNVKLYVEDLNPECKKTILFLHGWPGSHKTV